MEVGANRKSLIQLAITVALLAIVVYFQFFRDPAAPEEPRRTQARPAAVATASNEPAPRQVSATRRTGGRFQPRLGRSKSEGTPDPMTAEATLRKNLLDRVRGIEEPAVERDIFNFGRPKKPEVKPPTQAETDQAQARLEAAMRKPKPAPAKPAPRKAPVRARPPAWKYYGLASLPGAGAQRAFLLDGDEILVTTEGALIQERYRIGRIGLEALVLEDVQAEQEFTIPLESSK